MQTIQWIVAAGTGLFVVLVGYFQWRTAQQKAALDLFDRRHEVFDTVRKSVDQILSGSYDTKTDTDFSAAHEMAYFFFGDDVIKYLNRLWHEFGQVKEFDTKLKGNLSNDDRRTYLDNRKEAFNVVQKFYGDGQPLFGRYMRFEQKVGKPLFGRW